MIDERMAEASFDAQELAVVSVDVTVARDGAHHFARARAERHLTTIRTERAGRDSLREFRRPRLMTIGCVEQCTSGADFDAVAAVRTVEPAAVSADDRVRAASSGFN